MILQYCSQNCCTICAASTVEDGCPQKDYSWCIHHMNVIALNTGHSTVWVADKQRKNIVPYHWPFVNQSSRTGNAKSQVMMSSCYCEFLYLRRVLSWRWRSWSRRWLVRCCCGWAGWTCHRRTWGARTQRVRYSRRTSGPHLCWDLQTQERALHWHVLHIDDLVQDCSNSIALAMELLQFCTKPSIWCCLAT